MLASFAALLCLVPVFVSAADPIQCSPVDSTDTSLQWHREEPIYTTNDLQVVYKTERKNKYDGHDYIISASVDLAFNAYIGCKSPNGNGRQFMVSFKGADDNVLGSYWIQKDVDCIISQQIKRADVKSITSRERKY